MVKRGSIILLIIGLLTFFLISFISGVEAQLEFPTFGGGGKFEPTDITPTKIVPTEITPGTWLGAEVPEDDFTIPRDLKDAPTAIKETGKELFCPLKMGLNSDGDCEGYGILKGRNLFYKGIVYALSDQTDPQKARAYKEFFEELTEVGPLKGEVAAGEVPSESRVEKFARARTLFERIKSLGKSQETTGAQLVVPKPSPSTLTKKPESDPLKATLGATRGTELLTETGCRGRIVRDFATGTARCELSLGGRLARVFRPLFGARIIPTSGPIITPSVYPGLKLPTTYEYSTPVVGPRTTPIGPVVLIGEKEFQFDPYVGGAGLS